MKLSLQFIRRNNAWTQPIKKSAPYSIEAALRFVVRPTLNLFLGDVEPSQPGHSTVEFYFAVFDFAGRHFVVFSRPFRFIPMIIDDIGDDLIAFI